MIIYRDGLYYTFTKEGTFVGVYKSLIQALQALSKEGE